MQAGKLLLVEDDPALSELLEYRFSNEGYEVRTTSDGDEALLLAAEDVPDLVILDWTIPPPTGIDLLDSWRGAGLQMAVLMLTGRDSVEDLLADTAPPEAP